MPSIPWLFEDLPREEFPNYSIFFWFSEGIRKRIFKVITSHFSINQGDKPIKRLYFWNSSLFFRILFNMHTKCYSIPLPRSSLAVYVTVCNVSVTGVEKCPTEENNVRCNPEIPNAVATPPWLRHGVPLIISDIDAINQILIHISVIAALLNWNKTPKQNHQHIHLDFGNSNAHSASSVMIYLILIQATAEKITLT